MANIRNSISLQDHMTPVFRSIIRSMDSTMKVMRQLDKQANNGTQSKAYKNAQRDIQRANNELIKMQNNLSRCDKEAGKVASSANGISFAKAGSGLSSFLTGLSSALYLAKNIASALSSVMETPDTMAAMKYRLDTYDTTNATGSQLMSGVYKTAQDSRSDITSTGNLASRILVSGATNGDGSDAIKMAGILNKASFLGGSSSEESKRALLQLSQGLASGALQGDELRAIREQSPGLTDTLAKGLSSLADKGALPDKFKDITMGDLKELGSEGELTSQRIIAAFREMEDYVDTTFEKSPKQFGQAVTGILNVWKRWLGLMGEGDNALAKINEKAWELLEWFESPEGDEFFTNLANGVNFVVDCILGLIDGVADAISWFSDLENSSEILQSALITLGIVGVATGLATAIAWAIANWQILLVVAAIGLVIYALLEMGVSAGEIIGGIGAGILWILAVIAWVLMAAWDIIIAFIVMVIDLVVGAVTVIIWAAQLVVQIIMWALLVIDGIIITIINTILSVILAIGGLIGEAITGIYGLFVGLGEAVLGVLWGIASAIDAIFGSNLADSVAGWMSGLADSVVDLEATIGVSAAGDAIDSLWSNNYKNLGEKFTSDDWFILDNMGDVWNGAYDIVDGVNNGLFSAGFDEKDFSAVGNWAMNGTDGAMKFGKNLDSTFGDFGMKLEELGDGWSDGLSLDGGKLDSVGSIGSDVDISDEDLQLLRDVAARDFLLTLQTSTPQINNTFGDIKETADVDKILETIQDMVDEQLAVSLVID